MARTPLLRSLVRIARDHQDADLKGIPVDQVHEELSVGKGMDGNSGVRISRRDLLVGGAATVAAAMLPASLVRARGGSGTVRVAIIGGGLAGLSAALVLADNVIPSTIYEAMDTVCGRTRSTRPEKPGCGNCHAVSSRPYGDLWDNGQITDIFGELIDTGHTQMQALAQRFHLPLIDLLGSEPAGATETYRFLGDYYTKAEADADFGWLYQNAIKPDLHAAGYPTTYNASKPGGRALDGMSIYDWIESRVPGGHDSPMGRLLDVAYNIEFGAETTDQSSLNLLYLLGYGSHSEFSAYGASDERYRIAAGIQALPEAMAQEISRISTIRTGWRLEFIGLRSDGSIELSFDAGKQQTVIADYVVLALPFAAFGNFDYNGAGFDVLKRKAILELGRGHNGKMSLQFTRRFWNEPGPWGISGGSSYADTGYQTTWEATRGQGGSPGILVDYTGGSVTDAMSLRHPYGDYRDPRVLQDADRFLTRIEPVFPGLRSFWNGRCEAAMPHTNPYWNCSYSYWKVGQYQMIAGYESVRQGNILFAGEHTSLDFQGWMEGAAREGARAGTELARELRRSINSGVGVSRREAICYWERRTRRTEV